MLKKSFLATTALVLCVSTSLAAQKPERPRDRLLAHLRTLGTPVHVVHGFPVTVMMTGKAGEHRKPRLPQRFARGVTFNNLDKDDPNAQFVSWYGYTATKVASCFSSHSGYHECVNDSSNNAIPIIGLGYRAKKITVPIGSGSPSAEYNVGIYSATASGLPGNELAGASTTASDTVYCCTALRTVDIDIKLKAGVKYFVEVAGGQNCTTCVGEWNMESLDWSGDEPDYWHYNESGTYGSTANEHYTFHYSSPWHLTTSYPANPAAKVY